MQTWIVWTAAPVNNAALRQFAEQNDGYWNEEWGGEAVIQQGDARIYLSAAMANDEENVIPESVDDAASRMGRIPVSAVWISIGHAEGSARLAEVIADKALKTWGGLLDLNSD